MTMEGRRRAIEATPRMQLADAIKGIWKDWTDGHLTEEEAGELDELARSRQKAPLPPSPAPRRVGSRPRSTASMHRRRRWAASSWLPPRLAEQFTQAEQGALGVVMAEIALTARCELCHGAIAGRAGVSVSTVKRAMAEARRLGLLAVKERRVSRFRNLPNVVTILSAELRTWVATRGRGLRAAKGMWGGGGGVQTGTTMESIISFSMSSRSPATRGKASRCAGKFGSDPSRPRQTSGMPTGAGGHMRA